MVVGRALIRELASFATSDIFDKIIKLETALRLGDRVEIYRPTTCDPQTISRREGVEDGGE